MQELRRQAYLKAMGMTPWVARRTLPGAPETAVLEWPAPVEPQARTPESPLSVPETPAEKTKPHRPEQTATPRPAPPAADSLRFTLHAFSAPGMVLLAQQADPGAPEPGREEQRMLAGLLRYLGVRDRRPRSFAWPLPGMQAEADHAHASLEAFLRRLCQDAGCDRVLWMLKEPLAAELLRGERFRSHEWAGLRCLPVASLEEMFRQPAEFKRRSWQAMVRHGFQA